MCRAKLWRAAIPEQAPVAPDVDWEALGKGYQLAGGSIKQAVVRAATQAALRIEVTPAAPPNLLLSTPRLAPCVTQARLLTV